MAKAKIIQVNKLLKKLEKLVEKETGAKHEEVLAHWDGNKITITVDKQ